MLIFRNYMFYYQCIVFYDTGVEEKRTYIFIVNLYKRLLNMESLGKKL